MHTTSGFDSFCRAFEKFSGEEPIDALYFTICKSKEFSHFSFAGKLARYSAFRVILDEKLCSRANGFDKLLLRTAVCML